MDDVYTVEFKHWRFNEPEIETYETRSIFEAAKIMCRKFMPNNQMDLCHVCHHENLVFQYFYCYDKMKVGCRIENHMFYTENMDANEALKLIKKLPNLYRNSNVNE